MLKKFDIIWTIFTLPELKNASNEYEEDFEIRSYIQFPSIEEVASKLSNNSASHQDNSKLIHNIKLDFSPNNQVLFHICQKSNWTQYFSDNDNNRPEKINNIQTLYSKYCLFSFVKFVIEMDFKVPWILNLIESFTKLKNLKNAELQQLINSSFSILFSDYFPHIEEQALRKLVPSLFDFLTSESYDNHVFFLLPLILKYLLDKYGFEPESLTAEFAALIQMILTEKTNIQISPYSDPDNEYEEINIVTKMYKYCEPYFLNMNDCALNLLRILPKFLDPRTIDAFFLKIPFCLERIIDSNSEPLINIPETFETNYHFQAIQSPPSLSQFTNSVTFPNGIQFNSSNKYCQHFHFTVKPLFDPETNENNFSLDSFLRNEVVSKIFPIFKFLNENVSYASTFLLSFKELIHLKKDDKFLFEYLSLYVYILTILEPNMDLEVPIPSETLFNPTYEITNSIHNLRLNLIRSLLKFDLKSLEKFLRDTIMYPIVMTEILIIFNEIKDDFITILLNTTNKNFMRLFKDIGSVYQFEDINNSSNRELIETPRTELLHLLSNIYEQINEVIMKDTITIHFFFSHFFEVNLQSFFFDKFCFYIGHSTVSSEFIQVLIQFLQQIMQQLPDKRAFSLLFDLISSIVKNSTNLNSFVALNDVLCEIVTKLDISNESSSLADSWTYIDLLLTLYTSESLLNIKIPQLFYNSIEKVLIRFISLSNESQNSILRAYQDTKENFSFMIFKKLVQLMAGSFLPKFEYIFNSVIANFEVLNTIFSVFHNSSEINVFTFCYQICRYSYMNCLGLHNCAFDAVLIDFIQKNRDDFILSNELNNHLFNEPALSSKPTSLNSKVYFALMTVCEIMKIVSSPTVVQQIISLFTPVNCRYITFFHSILVQQIREVLIDEKNSPAIIISLIEPHKFNLKLELNFTFTSWIYIDSSSFTSVINLKLPTDNSTSLLSVTIEKQLIYVNNELTYIQIPKSCWVFFAISFNCVFDNIDNQYHFKVELYTGSAKLKTIENVLLLHEAKREVAHYLDNFYQNPTKNNPIIIPFDATIGGNESVAGRMGNFGFFRLLTDETITELFRQGQKWKTEGLQLLVKRLNPLFFANDTILQKSNFATISYSGESKTFSNILLNSFEIETFLPLFAQLDLPIHNPTSIDLHTTTFSFEATDLAELLKVAFETSNLKINEDFDFSILAHILINSDSKHRTFRLYETFYSIYRFIKENIPLVTSNKEIESCDILNRLHTDILLNFQIWSFASSNELIQIIELIKNEKIVNDLSQLLIILNLYFWYQLPHTSYQFPYQEITNTFDLFIELNKKYHRDPNLDIINCRNTLLSIFLPLVNSKDSVEITENDFICVLNHCFWILNSSQDLLQIYDLLNFLIKAEVSKIREEKLNLVLKILSNDFINDNIIIMLIRIIIKFKHEFNITKHINNLFYAFSKRKDASIQASFLESLIGMIEECPQLFELCSYISMHRKESILYYRIKPSPIYNQNKTWPFWATLNAMVLLNSNKINEAKDIYNFLIRCNLCEETFLLIFYSIRVFSGCFSDFAFYLHRSLFFKCLIEFIANENDFIDTNLLYCTFSFIAYSILFSRFDNELSTPMKELFEHSPFDHQHKFETNPKLDFNSFSNPIQLSIYLKTNKLKCDFEFGLNVNKDFQWGDAELAYLLLNIAKKIKSTKIIEPSLLIASFLLNKPFEPFIKSFNSNDNFGNILKRNLIHILKDIQYDFQNTSEISTYFQTALQNIPVRMPDLSILMKDFDNLDFQKYGRDLITSVRNQFLSNSNSLLTLPTISDDLQLLSPITNAVEYILFSCENGMKRWETLWGNMIIIGGAWNFSSRKLTDSNLSAMNVSDSNPKWKRDFSSTVFYCPMKLKKNKRFDPHIQASITREIGNAVDAMTMIQEYRGKIETQYRKHNQETLLTLSDDFEQALNRTTKVSAILQSQQNFDHDSKQDKTKCIPRSTSLPKIPDTKDNSENQNNQSILLFSGDDSTSQTGMKSNVSSSSKSSLLLSPLRNNKIEKQSRISKIESFKCEIVKPTKDIKGSLFINEKEMQIIISSSKTDTEIISTSTTEKVITNKSYRIPIRRISEIFLRKRFQHPTAIEIFCIDGKSSFISFKDIETTLKVVDHIHRAIKTANNTNIILNDNNQSTSIETIDIEENIHPSQKNYFFGTSLKRIQKNFDYISFIQQQPFTKKWINNKISNFEYLLKLNIFSGRSFTDLSLYPFFPWIISEFDTDTLDLNDFNNFRDLTQPIGALGEERLNELLNRMSEMKEVNANIERQLKLSSMKKKKNEKTSYQNMASLINISDGFEEPYLYFAYVICPLSVFLYLIRMEPFTTLHINMQSGKFDHGSRIFSSIKDSYHSSITSLNNYRELPPDFFFQPETLINMNQFDFGKNKYGVVNDVEFPKWVPNNDAYEFVYMMRKALESQYVSEFLPDWIDLMWGYKQTGEEAIKANNIYAKQLYGSVWDDFEKESNRNNNKDEIEATLCHVGQIPPQLFREKHLKRLKMVEKPLFPNITLIRFSVQNGPNSYLNETVLSSFISFEKSSVLNLSVCSMVADRNKSKKILTKKIVFSIKNNKTVKIIQISNYFKPNKNSEIARVKKFANEICLVLQNGSLVNSVGINLQEKISTIAFDQGYLAAVDDDSTVHLFGHELNSLPSNLANSSFIGKPIKFYGEKVVCCDLSKTFKLVVCGTFSGHIFTCSLFEAVKVNAININDTNQNEKSPWRDFVPKNILISKSWGFIICYAESVPNITVDIQDPNQSDDEIPKKQALLVYGLNGHLIRRIILPYRVTSMCTWASHKAFDYVAIGTDDGRILAFEAFYLCGNNSNKSDQITGKSSTFNSIYSSTSPTSIISCCEEKGSIVAVTKDSQLVFAPLPIDFV